MSIRSFFKRKFRKKKPLYYLNDSEGLDFLDEELSKTNIFGLDTEFDWRTTYFPKLSLIQITANSKLFLIDCLDVDASKILKKYLENNFYLKVFHSVRSDATVLSKCLNINTLNVFDIQVADRLLQNSDVRSYGKIVKSFLGIELKKSETNSNWLKRPLSDNQIQYACEDVDFLLEIYSSQKKKLKKQGNYNEVLSRSEQEATLGNSSLKKLRLKKLKKKLSLKDQKIFLWREEMAEKDNVPPTYIVKDKYLKKLSKIKMKGEFSKKEIMKIIGNSRITENFISEFS